MGNKKIENNCGCKRKIYIYNKVLIGKKWCKKILLHIDRKFPVVYN